MPTGPSLRFRGKIFKKKIVRIITQKCGLNAIFQGILSTECDFLLKCYVNYYFPFNDQNTIAVYTVTNRCIMFSILHINIY